MTQQKQQFVLPSTTESIAQVENIVHHICQTYDLPEDIYGNILIALTEAVNNAIYHGNKAKPNKKVIIEIFQHTQGLLFSITDEGKGFDYQHLPDPTLPENISKIGGRGIFIIYQLADGVQFKNKGKTIQIQFNMPVTAA